MKTLILIPAFNEERNLEPLIEDIRSYNYDYLIINDNSTDGTVELAKKKKFNVINMPINVGLAGVTRVGFKYASENNYDCAICIDGDGQHQPKYIHDLIKEIENGHDYVVGSRFCTQKKPFTTRMIGSRLICLVIKLKSGRKVSDPTSGMRAVGKKVMSDFAQNMNFYAEPDAMCYCIKKGYDVKEVQVEMLDRKEGASYFTNPFKTITYMFGVVVSILLMR